jgi:2-polyprenyl-3-methyl-5-hydroxy-6-metoxy-1,4-benzoquinol methylase
MRFMTLNLMWSGVLAWAPLHWKIWTWLHSHLAGSLSHLPFLCTATVASWRAGPDVESSSDEYALRFRGAVGKWQIERQNQLLLDLLAKWKNASVLDVGGGHGQYTDDLIAQGYQLTVVGSTPETVHRIRGQVDAGQCQFEMADLMQLPHGDQEFDCVVSVRLLAHVEDPEGYLAELCRVARHAVVIDFPPQRSFNMFNRLLFPLKHLLERKSTRPYTVFPEERVAAILAQNGFSVTGRRPQFCTPMVLHRVVRWVGLIRLVELACKKSGLTKRMGSPILLCAERQADTATSA